MAAVIAFIFVLLMSPSVHAQALRTYTETRYGTSALVPADWHSDPIHGERDVSGRYFYSQDGETWIAVLGTSVRAGVNPRTAATASDERVTYAADGARWFVRSGFKEDRIFYRKVILSCGGRSAHVLAFEYPAERKREHDRLVTLISRSLRAGTRGSC